MSEQTETALTAAFRKEWPRLIAAALRITGELQMAEDAAQETLLTALDHWPLQGIPDRPGAWLMTACRNRARNMVRDASRARQRLASLPQAPGSLAPDTGTTEHRALPQIADDELRLIALCC